MDARVPPVWAKSVKVGKALIRLRLISPWMRDETDAGFKARC
ncbi:hypothetical protein GRAN_2234 [Granulicella sibirica]|uniref:Uncharacterized protein n=1 Tax=Granulicella sibirica TaxID=2479048 RepID=A0A4V1L6D9_9BACT|nr:hypothetical protein GRAN_2234 [Granulicella sibirica]